MTNVNDRFGQNENDKPPGDFRKGRRRKFCANAAELPESEIISH